VGARPQALLATGRLHPFPRAFPTHPRSGCHVAGHPRDLIDIDPGAGHAGDDAVAHGVVAQRPGKARLPAEARNGDCGVGGAAAAGDDEILHRRLRARRREPVDPKDEILDRNSGAEHASMRWFHVEVPKPGTVRMTALTCSAVMRRVRWDCCGLSWWRGQVKSSGT
jgi:hypothetical protein